MVLIIELQINEDLNRGCSLFDVPFLFIHVNMGLWVKLKESTRKIITEKSLSRKSTTTHIILNKIQFLIASWNRKLLASERQSQDNVAIGIVSSIGNSSCGFPGLIKQIDEWKARQTLNYGNIMKNKENKF